MCYVKDGHAMSPSSDHLLWVKSSQSVASGACVELALADDLIALRDSKNPDVPPLYYTRAEFEAFLYGAKHGEFDYFVRQP
jgi:uncharacterized protein DUF397